MGRTLDRGVLIGIGLVVTLVVLTAALTYRNTHRLNEDAGWVAHTHEVLDLTSDVLLTMVDAETGERGFIITGREEFLEPYNAALARLNERMQALKEKTRDNARQQERIKKLDEMAAARLAFLEEAIALRRQGEKEAQAFLLAKRGKAQMDDIRELVANMKAEERDSLRDRERQSASAYQLAVTTSLVTAIVGLVMVGAFVWLLERSLQSRRKAATLLHEQREWFRTTLESIGDAVVATDAVGRVVFLNPEAQRLTGWTQPEIDKAPLDNIFHIVNEQSRRSVENPVVKVLREGKVVGLANHTLLISRNGTEHPIAESAAPIKSEAGATVGVVLVFRDVTEQRRAETSLRASEARNTAILQSALDCIITMDHEGNVVEFNPAAESAFGYSRAQIVERSMAEMIVPPSMRASHRRGLAHYLATGEGPVLNKRIEMTALRADGSEFPVELAIIRIPTEGPPLFTAHLRDITERKRAEHASRFLANVSKSLAALVDSRSTMQKLAGQAVPLFADWCAVDMVEADAGVRTVAIAHADPARIELAHALEQRYTFDPTAPFGAPNVLRTGKSEMLAEIPDSVLTAYARDPEHLHILRGLGLKSYICVPLVARDKTVGAVTFVAAESGRRYDAADLAVAEDLAHRASIALENALLYSEVRAADHRKDEFLAMLAHELRNPLAPIRNALLIMKQPGAESSVVERMRAMMERQVLHMTRMVDDLLDVSRITRGKIELRKEVVDLAAVVSRTLDALRPLLEDRRHELTVALPPEPVRLEADPTRLEQVLMNLLNNAVKYTEPGGHIWLRAGREDGELIVRVKDTGMGLPTDMLSSIFDPFVQSDRVLHHSQGGLGIGLTLVRSLVEMHGGSVTAHSEGFSKGSEFVVRLPVLSQKEDRTTSVGTESQPAGAIPRRSIVVVDDNVDAAESLALLLRLQGHEVRVAHDGTGAVAMVDADPPDIVFLDIGMPVMNGYHVAELLRRRPRLKNLVLVAMTGWGQEEDRRRSQEAGFDHHIVKPADPQALNELLTSRLTRSPG